MIAAPIFVGAAWIIYVVINTFIATDVNVKTSIIGGIFAFGTALFAFWKERGRAVKEAHREKKIEVYSIFFDMIFDLLKATKNSTADSFTETDDFKDKMYKLMKGVVFYGSPGVVLAYGEWSLQVPSDSEVVDSGKAFRAIGRVLLAMRDDIGLSNKGLDEINIHQVYVNEDLKKLGM